MTIIAREATIMTHEIDVARRPALPGDPIAQACRLRVRSLESQADACRDRGQYGEAERLLRRALAAAEHPGPLVSSLRRSRKARAAQPPEPPAAW